MPPCSRPRTQDGFVLVLVLWMLVAMAIGAAALMLWSRGRVAEVQAGRDAVDARIAMIGTRDTLLYLRAIVPPTQGGFPLAPLSEAELATRRLDEFGGLDKSPRGGELRLDGTPYTSFGGVVVELQDEAGLVGLGAPATAPVPRLLEALGRSPSDARRLHDALQDYIDADGLRRIAGAEARDYRRLGLPPPANRPLVSSRELPRVLGWHALPRSSLETMEAWTSVAYSGALNLNTAPESLVQALVPECQRVCVERLRRRDVAPFLSGRDFEAQAAARLPGDRDIDFRTAPSEYLRMTLKSPAGSAWRIHVRWTALADRAAPWSVDAAYRVPRTPDDESPKPIRSPLFAAPALAGP